MAFKVSGDGILWYQERLCVSIIDGSRERILAKAYESCYPIHPSSIKMHHDLKNIYWWNNMKWDIASFMAKCMVCQ